MAKQHHYELVTTWKGNTGEGTATYRGYKRDWEMTADRKSAIILGSSDPSFRGDPTRYNPEELLVGALSTCHMLSLLHLCADAGITVTEYTDRATGTMDETPDGSGHLTEVILHPSMTITDESKIQQAVELHERAHHVCFIANSVNFPVRCEPVVVARG